MKKIAVLTSGGDAPGMNAALRAAQRSSLYHNCRLFGVRNGFKGIVEGDFKPITRDDVSRIINRGGTILGSVRFDEFQEPSVQSRAASQLQAFGIDGVLVVGGGGSFKGARALSRHGIPVIGIPATIDNDVPSTDYSIGFFTALNTAVESIDKLRDTSDSHQRCSVVEIMGRSCGDLTLYAGIASGSEIIITPETGFDEDEVIERVSRAFKRNKRHALVVITEHMTSVSDLAKKIEEATDFETRATVLGHIQRGGSPKAFDRIIATEMMHHAVHLLSKENGDKILGIRGNRVVEYDIEEALNMSKPTRELQYNMIAQLKD